MATTIDTEARERREAAIAELRTRPMYDAIGGEATLRAVIDRFYEIMDTDQSLAPLRAVHGRDLSKVKNGLFEFLSGWLGGPNVYIERHGSPCLTGVHLPLGIDGVLADMWALCMARAMNDGGVPLRFSELMIPSLTEMAHDMRTDRRAAP